MKQHQRPRTRRGRGNPSRQLDIGTGAAAGARPGRRDGLFDRNLRRRGDQSSALRSGGPPPEPRGQGSGRGAASGGRRDPLLARVSRHNLRSSQERARLHRGHAQRQARVPVGARGRHHRLRRRHPGDGLDAQYAPFDRPRAPRMADAFRRRRQFRREAFRFRRKLPQHRGRAEPAAGDGAGGGVRPDEDRRRPERDRFSGSRSDAARDAPN